MSFSGSGFSFPGTGQNPQQNTGTQRTSGSTFGSFATGMGGGGNMTPTGGGLFGGGTTGTSNTPPALFSGGGTTTGTTGGNAPGGGLFAMKPATGGPFGNLGSTGTTWGSATTANTNTPTTAPTTGSGLFSTNPNPPTGSNITPAAAAATWSFNKPPEGAAASATSNVLGLNTAGTGTSGTSAPSGNLFGNKTGAIGGGMFGNLGTASAMYPATTTTAGTTGGGLFSSTPATGLNSNTTSGGLGLFGGLRPGGTTATTTAPTTLAPAGGPFDAKPTTAAPSTGTTSGFGLFSGLKPPGTTAMGTGTTAAGTGTGSTSTTATAPGTTGLKLFAPKPDTATTPTSATPASTTTTTAPNLGGLFGGARPTTNPGTSLGLGTASTAPAAGTTGTTVSAAATTPTPTDTAKEATKPTLGLGGGTLFSGLGAKPTAATTPTAAPAAATPTTAKAVTTAAVPAPSVLRGKTIEEVVKKWATELDDQAKEFASVASEVAQWDRALVENGQYISTLYSKILEAEATQNAIDQNLDHVEQQQKELIAQLDKYEKETKEIFDGPTGGLRVIDMGPADAERDRNYTLAANLNLQLDELSKSLSQMIESVNALTLPNSPHATSPDSTANGKSADEDPLQQIGAVLNAHLKSLQWIDETVRDVEGKVQEAERRMGGGVMGASVLGQALGETMRAGTPGGGLPAAFAGLALRQSEGPRQRGFGLGTTIRR